MSNIHGLFNARKGVYEGSVFLVTHRDPKSGDLWLDECLEDNSEIERFKQFKGRWVNSDSVKF